MDLRQLRCFMHVAELENFTLAAERMNLAQSALSRQIMNLEADLGIKLFDRSKRRVRLTRSGDVLRARARSLLELADHIRDEVVEQTSDPSGTVMIGAIASFGSMFFPRLAKRCKKLYPRIHLQFIEGLTHNLQELALRDRIDIAILAFPDPDRSLQMTFLCKENLYVLSAASNDPRLGPACSFAQAAALPLALTGIASKERLWYERYAILKGVNLNIVVEAEGLAVLKDLAQAGVAHLLLPASAIWNEMKSRRWRMTRIRGASVERMVGWRAGRTPSPAALKINECILDEVLECRRSGLVL
jgi:LysR family nitrogen assimilation transcriptional regulator